MAQYLQKAIILHTLGVQVGFLAHQEIGDAFENIADDGANGSGFLQLGLLLLWKQGL